MDEQARRRLAFANSLLFETPGGLRFTQDSPILPNVWLAFAENPHRQHELILTSNQNGGTGLAAQKIRTMLNNYRGKKLERGIDVGRRPRVSYIPGQLAVKLYFDELMRVVLPLTQWWHETYDELRRLQSKFKDTAGPANWFDFPQPDPGGRETDLFDALMLMRRELGGQSQEGAFDTSPQRQAYIREIPPDLIWFVRITGLIAHCQSKGHNLLDEEDELSPIFDSDFALRRREREDPDRIEKSDEQLKREEGSKAPIETARMARRIVAEAFTGLYWDWSTTRSYPKERLIWRITKNRPIRLAVNNSALTIKADAAVRLFDIKCDKITWAVVDSGIDPGHDAFKTLTPKAEADARKLLKKDGREDDLRVRDLTESRIVKTLDFTRLRELLDHDIEMDEKDEVADKNRAEVLGEIARRMPYEPG
ncbi:MAG: hypothetical protein AAF231_13920, partial [Pseudomonadota bacterium]